MRYLWVEDFNDGSETEEELKERLVDCFGLDDDQLVIKNDLASTIKFLEKKDNFQVFDAVLIDIRFPIGNTSNLYEKYFSDFITRDFFYDNINDASGIMLYLLLVFRYNISQKKIAFISANIRNDNNKIRKLQEMIELIVKSKYEKLSSEETRLYATTEAIVGREYLGIQKKEDRRWGRFVKKDENEEYIVDEATDLDELIFQLRELPILNSENFEETNRFLMPNEGTSNGAKTKEKYYFVKEQFEKVGFVMPAAFDKPRIGEMYNKKYSFFEWENQLYSNLYNAVRSNLLGMSCILRDYFRTSNGKAVGMNKNIYDDFVGILKNEKNKHIIYDTMFFSGYISDIMRLFELKEIENEVEKCNIMLKEISGVWEGTIAPRLNSSSNLHDRSICELQHCDSRFYAYHATMKIVRNWIGHQGICNTNILDVGFVFCICMRGLFSIDSMPSEMKEKYFEYEEKLFSIFDTVKKDISVDIEDSLSYFIELNNATKKGNGDSRLIFDRISGLGHEKSEIRRQVSFDEIYMLFYHLVSVENQDKKIVMIRDSIKERTWSDWKDRYNKRFEKYVCV